MLVFSAASDPDASPIRASRTFAVTPARNDQAPDERKRYNHIKNGYMGIEPDAQGRCGGSSLDYPFPEEIGM